METKNFSGSPLQVFNGQRRSSNDKEMFPRIRQQKRTKTPEEQQNKQPKGPGIFFDMQKGMQYQKIENVKKMLRRNSCQSQLSQNPKDQIIQATAAAAVSSAGGFINLSDKNSQKLYSPYEYLHYATKINFSKENYLSALSQLGYSNVNTLNTKPYNDIMNKTQNIIQKSYSLKYLGIIDGNMGILSKRVKLNDLPRETIVTQNINGKKQKSRRIKRQNRARESASAQHANISVVPSNYRPDLYNSYLITQYSLPKYLKPIVKEKDCSIIEDKQRLEKWHNEQLRKNSNFFQNEAIEEVSQQPGHGGINVSASTSINAGVTNYNGKMKQKRSSSQKQLSPRGNQNHESMNKYYAEVPEESLCYAIIDKSNETPMNQSYSRLINTIQKRNNESQNQSIINESSSIIHQGLKTTKNYYNNTESSQNLRYTTVYNSNPSIKFTQNQQLHDRFDHIAKVLNEKNKSKENENSNNKKLQIRINLQ